MESVKDRDEKFVGDFLGVAMDIISKSSNQQVQNGEKCHFMLMPKKVNKVCLANHYRGGPFHRRH